VKIPEQKVILCGEFGVGKSSLFRRFMNDTFTTATDRKSTMGLDHYGKVYNIKGKDLKLQLWDTGGGFYINFNLDNNFELISSQAWNVLQASPQVTTNIQRQQS
jgi:GTPase SAR1 family protein